MHYSIHRTVHCVFVQCSVHSALYTEYCTLYTEHWTLDTVHCTLYAVRCTLYTVHCTLYTVHCTLYTVYCTIYLFACLNCEVTRQEKWGRWNRALSELLQWQIVLNSSIWTVISGQLCVDSYMSTVIWRQLSVCSYLWTVNSSCSLRAVRESHSIQPLILATRLPVRIYHGSASQVQCREQSPALHHTAGSQVTQSRGAVGN